MWAFLPGVFKAARDNPPKWSKKESQYTTSQSPLFGASNCGSNYAAYAQADD